jgi:hypothetical protein
MYDENQYKIKRFFVSAARPGRSLLAVVQKKLLILA